MVTGGSTSGDGHRVPVPRVVAVIFDTDGVVTRTASVHAAAWKALFDAFLRRSGLVDRGTVRPLRRRGLRPRRRRPRSLRRRRRLPRVTRASPLPRGGRVTPPGSDTVCGLGNRKNERVRSRRSACTASSRSSRRSPLRGQLRAERRSSTAVVSASENCAAVLAERPAPTGCSTCASTASTRPSSVSPASPTRRCSSRPPADSGSHPAGSRGRRGRARRGRGRPARRLRARRRCRPHRSRRRAAGARRRRRRRRPRVPRRRRPEDGGALSRMQSDRPLSCRSALGEPRAASAAGEGVGRRVLRLRRDPHADRGPA